MKIYQHKVQYYETDSMGIVHHSNYIRWMEEARVDFLHQVGCDYGKMEESGIFSPVTAVKYSYKVPTSFSDTISISVWVEEFKGVRLKLGYEIRREDAIVCEGQSEHCFMNRDGKIISLKRERPEVYEVLMRYAK